MLQFINVSQELQARAIPIMKAIRDRNINQLNQLIQEGVDVDIQAPGGGKTPLHYAVECELDDFVSTLLQAKANPNSYTQNRTTPLHVAAKVGNVAIINKLLDAGAIINAPSRVGCTPLHDAAAEGHQHAVVALVERGADVHFKEYDYKLTPGALARTYQKHTVADYLANIGKGSSAKVSKSENNDLEKNFIAALQDGNVDSIVNCIRKGVNVNISISKNVCNPGDYTPYFSNQNSTQSSNSYGNLLNQHAKEYVSGFTSALHIAVKEKYKGAVKALLLAKANIDAKTTDGLTPLMFAVYENQLSFVRLLLTSDANPNIAAADGSTALHFAVSKGLNDIIQELLNHKADIDKADQDGETPLIVAIGTGKISIVNLLVKGKADVNKAKPNGVTPLFIAAQKGLVELGRILLTAGANVNVIRATDHCSPLHVAAGEGHLEMVKFLIDSGADKTQQHKNNGTAIEIARAARHLNVVAYLEKVVKTACSANAGSTLFSEKSRHRKKKTNARNLNNSVANDCHGGVSSKPRIGP